MSKTTSIPHIGIIGFGEAGQAFVTGWARAGIQAHINAFDVKTNDQATSNAMWDAYSNTQVMVAATLSDALTGADAIFSMVTADQAGAAATAAACHIPKGTLFFDCNSCAPDTKRASAQVITDAGGVYIDTAVMAPDSSQIE